MTLLKNLGEIEVIHLLQAYIDSSDIGSIEDAYLCNYTNPRLLVNVDTMSKNSDFLPQQTWNQIGSKLVVITFSDLGAKGAEPKQFLSSLVLENTMEETELRELVESIQKTSHKYNATYFGGDLGSSSEAVLTGIGLGSISEGKILSRGNAKQGDLVCVTGYFGLTSIGFDYLLYPTSRKFDNVPDTLLNRAIQLLYEPQPRISEGILLSKHELATASIDSSDGLAISLHWLSQASNLGIVINDLPIDPELNQNFDSQEIVKELTLFGGEEYELVFTIPPTKKEELQELFEKSNLNFHVIGNCIASKGVFISTNDILTPVQMRGWDAFRKMV
jgi:thiamine-monophosphate kinase